MKSINKQFIVLATTIFLCSCGTSGTTTSSSSSSSSSSSTTSTTSSTSQEVKLLSISATEPYKTTYIENEYFDPTGMIVTGSYSNGTEQTIYDYSYSPSGPLSLSDTKIVISYLTKETFINIKVNEEDKNKPSNGLYISLNDIEDVEIHSEVQLEYFKNYYIGEDVQTQYGAKGYEELSQCEEITLSWDVFTSDNIANYEKFRVDISEDSNFSDLFISRETTNTSLSIYNLKVGTTYYWRVSAISSLNEVVATSVDSFNTLNNAPRVMNIGGVTNVRDIGGYKNEYGVTLNQGVLYRTAKLNLSERDDLVVTITDDGKKEMNDVLKVRTEIDLRGNGTNDNGNIENISILGDTVNYVLCGINFTDPFLSTSTSNKNTQAIKKVFSILGDKSSYPVFFHCTQGTDRTGVIAFLIENLCGVSKLDIYKDYMFSNFASISATRTINDLNSHFSFINGFSGVNLVQKTEAYLRQIGVTDSQMKVVKDMMSLSSYKDGLVYGKQKIANEKYKESIIPENLTLFEGEDIYLPSITPTGNSVKYTSNNTSILTVKGTKITAVKNGVASLKATYGNFNISREVKVTGYTGAPVSLAFDIDDIITENRTKIDFIFSKDGKIVDKNLLTYKFSLSSNICEIDEDDYLVVKEGGTVTITIIVTYLGYIYTQSKTVTTNDCYELKYSISKVEDNVYQINANTYKNGSIIPAEIEYLIETSSVACVDKTGLVTFSKLGYITGKIKSQVDDIELEESFTLTNANSTKEIKESLTFTVNKKEDYDTLKFAISDLSIEESSISSITDLKGNDAGTFSGGILTISSSWIKQIINDNESEQTLCLFGASLTCYLIKVNIEVNFVGINYTEPTSLTEYKVIDTSVEPAKIDVTKQFSNAEFPELGPKDDFVNNYRNGFKYAVCQIKFNTIDTVINKMTVSDTHIYINASTGVLSGASWQSIVPSKVLQVYDSSFKTHSGGLTAGEWYYFVFNVDQKLFDFDYTTVDFRAGFTDAYIFSSFMLNENGLKNLTEN